MRRGESSFIYRFSECGCHKRRVALYRCLVAQLHKDHYHQSKIKRHQLWFFDFVFLLLIINCVIIVQTTRLTKFPNSAWSYFEPLVEALISLQATRPAVSKHIIVERCILFQLLCKWLLLYLGLLYLKIVFDVVVMENCVILL